MKGKSFGLVCSVAMIAQFAMAKPILWFHFDEKPCGSECVTTDRFVNSADIEGASELNGTPRGLKWATGTLDDYVKRVTYTNALDESTTWIDPKTGSKGDTRGVCLHVSGENDPSPAGSGHNGVITVPDNEKLHLNKFTVEFFMRKNVRVPFPNQVLPLQLYNSSSNTTAWQIRFSSYAVGQTTSSVSINGSTVDGGTAFETISYTTKYSLYDGAWHHIALTYDGEKCRLYCDYINVIEKRASIQYASNVSDSLLAIGASTRVGWGRYHGSLDELRICDEVLQPKEFLRSIPVVCDKDTLAYIPFNRLDKGPGNFGYYGMTNNLNEVFPLSAPNFPYDDYYGGALRSYMCSSNSNQPELTNDVPTASIRNGFFATNSVANGHALSLPAMGPYLIVADQSSGGLHNVLTNDSYTYEFFYKRRKDNEAYRLFCMHFTEGGKHYTTYLRHFQDSGKLCIQIATTNKTAAGAVAYVGNDSSAVAYVGKDTWHHIALVGDRLRRHCSVYYDYQPVITFTNTVIKLEKHEGSYVIGFCVGGAWESGGLSGEIDEVRITRRALTPREFLPMCDNSELKQVNGKNVLFYVPCDEDLKAYPFKSTYGSYNKVGTIAVGDSSLPHLPRGTTPIREQMGLSAATAKAAQGTSARIWYSTPMCMHGMKSFTIEWYGRYENPSASLPMLRFEGTLPGTNSTQLVGRKDHEVYWQLAGGGKAINSIYLGVWKENGKYDTLYWSAPQYRYNRWHHFALTAEKVVVDGVDKLECHLYVNHQACYIGDTPRIASIDYPMAKGVLYICGANSWGEYTGSFDEVRVTEGVLTTDEMLPAVSNDGLMMIWR